MNDPLHWPPGTPLMFGVARQLTGTGGARLDPPAAYAAQWLVGVALIVAVFALVRLVAGPWPAVGAAAAVALYPPLSLITGDMVSEPLGRSRSRSCWSPSRGRGGRRRRGGSRSPAP
jgi:hypothetical protein